MDCISAASNLLTAKETTALVKTRQNRKLEGGYDEAGKICTCRTECRQKLGLCILIRLKHSVLSFIQTENIGELISNITVDYDEAMKTFF